MRIAIDGGAICSNRLDQFGNYNFTKNLILGLSQFDKKNQYSFYSFCQEPDWFPKRKNIRYVKLWPTIFWLKGRISFEEIRKRNDVIFALNQAIPLITPSTIVSFSHGLSFRFFPQYYLDSHQILSQQLDEMMKRSSKIIVTSQRVKDELISISSAVEKKIFVLPFGIPFDMIGGDSEVKIQKNRKDKYFLFVGMNHPIKNIQFINTAFKIFIKNKQFSDYKLKIIHTIKRDSLNKLYREATAYLSASFYESFNLPVLEALSQNCPVIALPSAIIPELEAHVNIGLNEYEFAKKMKEAALGKLQKINLTSLRRSFSWEAYIKQLLELLTRYSK